jgi:hypothetical protein
MLTKEIIRAAIQPECNSTKTWAACQLRRATSARRHKEDFSVNSESSVAQEISLGLSLRPSRLGSATLCGSNAFLLPFVFRLAPFVFMYRRSSAVPINLVSVVRKDASPWVTCVTPNCSKGLQRKTEKWKKQFSHERHEATGRDSLLSSSLHSTFVLLCGSFSPCSFHLSSILPRTPRGSSFLCALCGQNAIWSACPHSPRRAIMYKKEG